MSAPLLRVAVVGATGALGGELIELLRERRFPIQELRPIATERSLGESVEWLGHELPIVTEGEALAGLDLAFVCTPPAAALDWVRRALSARVACFDFSGALAPRAEVPLLGEPAAADPDAPAAPLVSVPGAASAALARVLAPLAREVGLLRVVATICDGASGAGRAGIDALHGETVALFNQEDPPETPLGHGLAFDCLPASGPLDDDGATEAEARCRRELARLLGEGVRVSLTSLRIPVFAGMGIQVTLECAGELGAERAAELLAKTPGVELCTGAFGPSTRDAIGDDVVHVGRLRRDASTLQGLQLWLALDPVRVVGAEALRAAEARLRARS